MPLNLPVIGRLSLREYTVLTLGFGFVLFETLIRLLTLALPTSVLRWFYEKSRDLFYSKRFNEVDPTPTEDSPRVLSEADEKRRVEEIRAAEDFEELCALWGYQSESHVVQTKDGYLLGLHRLPNGRDQRTIYPGARTRKPVVYLHHEVWVCLTDAERCLPFTLADAGYDVWLGNNRGNKYSKKSIYSTPNQPKFWNYSIDDFCLYDIPDSIEYILNLTKNKSLSYVGFSQGTAQAFAALSIHPSLNEKVDIFIALAPAMAPAGLQQPIVDALMKASPTLMYLFFGRKSILPSTVFWQSILYPPIFVKVIDTALTLLFNWRGGNISPAQKLAAYAHLYSYTSTKSVVHWFQIMRNAGFQMYDDEVQAPVSFLGKKFYHPAKFPTRNIATTIFLLYGESDSLVDIDVMLAELPKHTTYQGVPNHEHLDMLWGRDVHEVVIPQVMRALKQAHVRVNGISDAGSEESGDGAEPDQI
ncbi:alpha/beta hydrolase family protein [Ceratobasidium sp. AG-Ba]|nr:alpha/beta hydrolase family protein [Ceratobasidium sp. AG-Ba]QRW05198.1 alpha/beta hydrolase family protein [Ceratobasidium sp. AG-Ba]